MRIPRPTSLVAALVAALTVLVLAVAGGPVWPDAVPGITLSSASARDSSIVVTLLRGAGAGAGGVASGAHGMKAGGVGGRSAAVDAAITDGTAIPALEPTALAGVTGQRVYADVGGQVIGARWAYAPGAAQVNVRIDTWLREQFAQHAALAGLPWPSTPVEGAPPGGMGDDRGCVRGSSTRPVAELLADRAEVPLADANGHALVISCDVVLAAGAQFSIRLRASEVQFIAGIPRLLSERVQVFSANLETGASIEGAELLAPGSLDTVIDQLRNAVDAVQGRMHEGRPIAQTLAVEASPRDLVNDVALLQGGGLVVRLPADAFVTQDEGDAIPIEVRLSPAAAAGVLSPAGQEAREALVAGAPWAAPPASGAPRTPCDLVPCVALTFDDGPGEYTPAILNALAARGATASFFVVGQQVALHPEVVDRMAREGHTLGNHTYSHINMAITPLDQILAQLERTDAEVRAACGLTPLYMRPPWASFDPRGVASYGRPIALWSADARDWQDPPVAVLTARVGEVAAPGAVVLMHDTHAGTAAAMPDIVASLAARGYRLVGMDQLVGQRPAGTIVRSALAS